MPDDLKKLGLGFLTGRGLTTLTKGENELLDSAAAGTIAECSTPLTDKELTTEATNHDFNTIRAALIRWMCSNPEAQKLIDPAGIRIKNYRIVGAPCEGHAHALGLGLAIPFPLVLNRCSLPEWLLLQGAEVPFIDLDECHVFSIAGDVLKVQGDLYLRDGFCSDGVVRFPGARIGGDFDCRGATLKYVEPKELKEPRTPNTALLAEGIHVSGDVLMTDWENTLRFKSTGRVNLDGAQIDGDLNCIGAAFENPAREEDGSGEALSVKIATIGGHVFLKEGFCALGAVRLTGSTIKGSLNCGKEKAEFLNEWESKKRTSGVALDLDGANIALDLNLSADKVDLPLVDHIRTGDKRFTAKGTVSLVGTHVGGTFHCKYGEFHQFNNPHDEDAIPRWRHALDLREAHVAFLCYPNQITNVNLTRGKLALDGFTYERISEGAKNAKDCIDWLELQYDPPQKGAFAPTTPVPRVKPPEAAGMPSDTATPEKHDKPSPKFFPQPYLQLAKVLREEGKARGAKDILIAMENRRPRKNLRDRIWKRTQRITIGYGYKSGRVFVWLLGLSILFAAIYEVGYLYGAMTPIDNTAYATFQGAPQLAPDDKKKNTNSHPGFHPFLYSIESSVPLLKFGQMDHWQPDPGRLQKGSGTSLPRDWFHWIVSLPGLLSLIHSGHVLLGWFLTTMAVAGITGLVRRE